MRNYGRPFLDPPGADAADGLFHGSSSVLPMELDEEMDSLVHETGDFSGVLSKLARRKKSHATSYSSTTSIYGLSRLTTNENCVYCLQCDIFVVCLA